MDFLHAIHKEAVVKTSLRESGVLATLWTGEWLVSTLPEGELMEALLAVVMAVREHLGLSVVINCSLICEMRATRIDFVNVF